MHKHFLRTLKIVIVSFGIGWPLFYAQSVLAESSSVIISRIQVREAANENSTNSSNEFIEIANNSSEPADITNWCLKYASASSPDNLKLLGCFTPTADNEHVLLPGYARAFAATNEYLEAHGQVTGYDFIFKATLSNDAGYVSLFNGATETDTVSWGVDINSAAGSTSVGSNLIERIELGDGQLKQTGSVADDFRLVSPALSYASSAQYVFDLCLNLADVQTEVPPGLSSDEKGNCSPPLVDVCLNIDGVQSTLPQGDMADEAGNCLPVDEGETQPPVDTGPDGSSDIPAGQTELPLQLSETLPNPIGLDTGNEFIEIYNPNPTVIDLSKYQIFVGPNLAVNFSSEVINGGDYLVLTNSDYSFTLVNTTGQIFLLHNGTAVDQISYGNPKEGWSWAKLDGVWQYTNRVTPGLANEAALASAVDTAGSSTVSQPCAEGQERNPETNRCRKIAAANSEPVPCATDQYRNPDTGRCKSLAVLASSVTACDPGEERNPETNRCRKIAVTTDEPAPCKPGQERNPETNRCHNIQAMTTADYSVAGVKTEKAAGSKMIWWLVGGVLAFGAVYAIFEWRVEIVKFCRRLGSWQWHRK